MGLPETEPQRVSQSSARSEAEWSLLQAACSAVANRQDSRPERETSKNRLQLAARQPLNWQLVLQLAEHHGVAPLVFQALSSLDSEAPAAGLSLLQRYCETNLHRTLFLTRELIRVLDHLDALAIEVLPYKGVALAETLYGDIALRQAGDIDLLIRPQDLPAIKNALRDLGYAAHDQFSEAEERAYLRSGYECAFDSNLGRNLLEVQWALQPRFYAVDFDMEGLFRRAIVVNVAGRTMRTPSSEDLFLVLALHAAKHVWGRLIWICDIGRILNAPALDWEWIERTAKSLGIVRLLQVTLLLTKLLLMAPIPSAAEKSFSPDQAAIALANEVVSRIGATSPNVESMSYFGLMMRLRERPADRLRFLQLLVLTPGPGEWRSVRLPAPLFSLYRLVRLSRLAARLIQK